MTAQEHGYLGEKIKKMTNEGRTPVWAEEGGQRSVWSRLTTANGAS